MTVPTASGGDDDVIRVIYTAVADYSTLIRETRRAREQTAALKRDIDALAGTTTVRVNADTSRARTDLAALIRDAVITARVVLQAAAARSELAALARDLVIKARLVVDATAVRTRLAAATRDLTVRVRAETDTAGLARLAAQLAQLRDLIVRVSVHADTASLTALRAQLSRLRDLIVQVRVDADTASLDALRARLRRLGGAVLRVTVDLDEAGLEARWRAILAHLESLGPIRLHIDIDNAVFARIAELEAAIEALRRRRGGDDDEGGGGGAGGGGSRRRRSIVPEGLSRAATLIAAIGSLIAAAVPVAAALALAVGTIGSALLAAGAAAGIFAVAAVGAVAKVAEAVKAYEKSGTLAGGPLGQVVAEFEALKTRYNELQKATQTDVFAVFSRGLALAVDLLDKVQNLVGVSARAIDAALAQVQQAINGAGFDEFLDFVGRQGPDAVAGFTRGLIGFAGGLGQLLQQFEPFISAFITGFGDAGQAFDRWAAGLDTNTGFQDFLTYARTALPQVIAFIKDLLAAAGNLFVALEPIGDVLLAAVDGAARLIAALPPGVLTVIVGAVLGLTIGIKAMQATLAVSAAYQAFTAFLTGLPGRLGAAAASLGAFRVALIALGTATVIGAAITAVVLAINAFNSAADKSAEANEKAANAADTHRRAVQSLTDALRANNGVVSKADRVSAYEDLDRDPVKLPSKYDNSQLVDKTQIKTVAGYAAAAGVDPNTLVNARLGDAKAIASSDAALAKLQDRYTKLADAASLLPKGDPEHLKTAQYHAEADAVAAAREQLGGYAGVMDEAQAKAKLLNSVTGEQTAASTKAAAAFTTQAAAAAAVRDALKADFGSDASVTAYTNATAAADAYTEATRAHRDAVTDAAQAETKLKDATEAVTEARAAAVQRIRDVQRALRDQAVDERQVALSQRTAQQRLDKLIASGGSDDEIEQARIDLERAQNAKADFAQDKQPSRQALQKELAKGVAGNKQLRDAITAQADARTALTDANTTLRNSAKQVTATKLAFQQAAGAMGLTTTQLDRLRTKMDRLKDKTVNLVLDTRGAEGKLAALLQGQYAIQLLAAHPDWGLDRALAEAKKQVPTVSAAAKASAVTGPDSGNLNPNVNPGRAGGGPLPPPPGYAGGGTVASPTTAGPVYGPGTGTSDSVTVRLPVGGPARLSRGEHIVTDAEVRSAPGGHTYLEAFRAGLRAGRPWGPAGRYARGGPAVLPAPRRPVFAVAMPALPTALPGYAAGGAVDGMRAAGTSHVDRSVTVNVGTINNPVPEPAGTSLYRQVRKAVDGDEG